MKINFFKDDFFGIRFCFCLVLAINHELKVISQPNFGKMYTSLRCISTNRVAGPSVLPSVLKAGVVLTIKNQPLVSGYTCMFRANGDYDIIIRNAFLRNDVILERV